MDLEEHRIKSWQDRWDTGNIRFHNPEVHAMLLKHFDKICPSGDGGRIFVPLCGKTLDMKWLSEQNMFVVGLDGVRLSLEQFMSEQNLNFTTEKIPELGEDCEVFKTADDKFHLYRGDIMDFSASIEGTFDAVWDRGSLVALRREDVPQYVKVIKSLIKPGGRCLVEVFDYDVKIMEGADIKPPCPPPPFPMYEAELKDLYEPEFRVEFIDRSERKLVGHDVHTNIVLLTKI